MIGQNKGANVAAKGENEAQSEVDYLFYTGFTLPQRRLQAVARQTRKQKKSPNSGAEER